MHQMLFQTVHIPEMKKNVFFSQGVTRQLIALALYYQPPTRPGLPPDLMNKSNDFDEYWSCNQ